MHSAPPTLLSGRIVLPDGGARQRYVLVRDGKIVWISRSRPPEAWLEDVVEVATGPQDWIFPGLLDLHTHASYNILPLWRSPRAPFDNRFAWRADAGYRAEVRDVSRKIRGHRAARQVFSELQALAGGTCVLDQNYPLDSDRDGAATVLCRDTGSAIEMGVPDGKRIRAVVDFFRPDARGRPSPARGHGDRPSPIDAYVQSRGRLQAILVHLAEGRSGFGTDRGVDPYSRAEFEAFMAHPALADIEAVRSSRLSIVHASGIDVDNAAHIDFLVERGIAVVWSPASNQLLYQDTLDAETLVARGVTVVLGSDWSPSGSKHVWEEAKFARFYLRAIGAYTSDADVFKMVTSQPARILGLPLGRVAEGARADFFVLRSPIESDSALEVFFSTSDKDVLATIVDGLPVYGDRGFLEQWRLDVQPLPKREGDAVQNKAVHLPESVGVPAFADEIDGVEDQLKQLRPPVYRSNLLVDSDALYQRRMHSLRARVERFGWSVRQWRKHGGRRPDAEVPIPPHHIRVHVRSSDGDRAQWMRDLGGTRLPAAIALGQPLGVVFLMVAILPSSVADTMVEVGITGFESDEEVADTLRGSVAGRVSDLLLGAESELWTANPRALDDTFDARSAYHLTTDPVDWHRGETRLSAWRRRTAVDSESFRTGLAETFQTELARTLEWDAAVVALWADYAFLWAHSSEQEPSDLPDDTLRSVADRVMRQTARRMDAKGSLSMRWDGLSLREEADVVRLQFTRRALIPW